MLVVHISGGSKKRKKAIRNMCELFYKKYFRSDKYLCLNIKHKSPIGSLMADCFGLDEPPYNEFEITIYLDSSVDEETYLRSLAHELIHVKQYTKGELKEYSSASVLKFMGLFYNSTRIPYLEQPWEIEAYIKEKELYNEYIKFYSKE